MRSWDSTAGMYIYKDAFGQGGMVDTTKPGQQSALLLQEIENYNEEIKNLASAGIAARQLQGQIGANVGQKTKRPSQGDHSPVTVKPPAGFSITGKH